jgi:hypothetical protein
MPKRNAKPRSDREKQTRNRVAQAISSMQRGASLSRAARENRVTTRTIKRYAGAALVQDRRGGRIRATKNNRLVRYLQIPGPNGPVEIEVRGSKAASEFAKYKGAVNRLLRGDRDAMAEWHGRKIAGIGLITDARTLISQAEQGSLPYSLYAMAGVAA